MRPVERGLYAFTRRLARESDPGRTHSLILRTLAARVRAGSGTIAIYRPLEDAPAIVATIGHPSSVVEHLRIGAAGHYTDSCITVPLVADRRRLAVVTLTDKTDDRPFTRDDAATLRVFAAAGALALNREAILAEVADLRRLATVDPLTGLYNRRHLAARLEAEVQRAGRQHQDLAVLMLDVDDFKRINDRRGHLEGDRALQTVAELLRSHVRAFDVCARFGGDEFVIVMPAAGRQIALRVAERIRREVKARASEGARVTLSVGIGMLGGLTTPTALLESADRALMAAKVAGKDAVWIDDPGGYSRQAS